MQSRWAGEADDSCRSEWLAMMIQGAGLERKTAGWVKISGDRAHVGIWKKKTTRGRRKAWLERLVENEAAVPGRKEGRGD